MSRVLNLLRSNYDKLESRIHICNRYVIEKEIERDNLRQERFNIPTDKKLTIAHYIGTLGPGGSERQLCNLAITLQHEMGMNVHVLTSCALEGELSHYLPYLIDHGIPAKMAEPCDIDSIMNGSSTHPCFDKLILKCSPRYLHNYLFALVRELLIIKPDILHCWLDYCNIVGGIAGIITGVPKIILSGRNVNPTNFPLMNQYWFQEWYKVLLKSSRVIFINNSKAGAEDYAHWLDIQPSSIFVVYNGIEFNKLNNVNHEEIQAFRKSIGISNTTPLVGGVFRFAPEKRPYDFIDVVKRVKAEIGEMKAVVAGSGILGEEMKIRIKQESMDNTIILLGSRTDIYTVMKACDLILLTSDTEGTPNVLLEAQYLGVPVVATDAGGIPEVVNNGGSGILHAIGDIKSMSDSVISILRNRTYAEKLGREGHRLTAERFSVECMVKSNLALYYEKDSVKSPYKIAKSITFYFALYFTLFTARFFKIVSSLLKIVEGKNLLSPKIILKSIEYEFYKLTGKRAQGTLAEISHETGHCYTAPIPNWIISDINGFSSLCLFEDGKPLGPTHALHDDIRNLGQGRYSHWSSYIYFSTSDNSDPRTNGRTYSFCDNRDVATIT